MLKKNYKQLNDTSNESKLDQVLWFIENYLPQKKYRGVQKKRFMNNLETEIIKQISKLASLRSKTLLPATKNTTISFTFGNWALPYLKLLKKIGIAKQLNSDALTQEFAQNKLNKDYKFSQSFFGI